MCGLGSSEVVLALTKFGLEPAKSGLGSTKLGQFWARVGQVLAGFFQHRPDLAKCGFESANVRLGWTRIGPISPTLGSIGPDWGSVRPSLAGVTNSCGTRPMCGGSRDPEIGSPLSTTSAVQIWPKVRRSLPHRRVRQKCAQILPKLPQREGRISAKFGSSSITPARPRRIQHAILGHWRRNDDCAALQRSRMIPSASLGGPSLAEFGPGLVEFGPQLFVSRTIWAEQSRVKVEPTSGANFERSRANFVGFWASVGRMCGPDGANVGAIQGDSADSVRSVVPCRVCRSAGWCSWS